MDRDTAKSKVDDLIDSNLRRVYEGVLQEDVPDRFANLLAQLERGEVPQTSESEAEG